ncbi:YolD-like family protein [Helicovermis profundi]|uniref:YolD-like family protein n=1 Tax=Helicovermis profundi TaxID=3065157 RepID=A0AAU9E3M4_9FIRM|nr:hypothetical protein HLPR_15150 [Clostridia bacterium S502]
MKKKNSNELKKYEDILHLPHHVSSRRPQMTISNRAAQFAPFAAVVGHNSAVKEAARYTDQRKELDEMGKALIDNQLQEIDAQLPNEVDVEVIYFKADKTKSGGEYINKSGKIKKIDINKREIHMVDGVKIGIDDVYSLVNNTSKSYK